MEASRKFALPFDLPPSTCRCLASFSNNGFAPAAIIARWLIEKWLRLVLVGFTRIEYHLSGLALELIDKALSVRSVESNYVFPSPRDAEQPIKPAAMTRAFGHMKKALDLGDIRPHDLRRTGATNLTSEQLGFPRFTVSKVLNHASDTGGAATVTGVYDQNEYLAEKRKALNAWALRVLEIVGDRRRRAW